MAIGQDKQTIALPCGTPPSLTIDRAHPLVNAEHLAPRAPGPQIHVLEVAIAVIDECSRVAAVSYQLVFGNRRGWLAELSSVGAGGRAEGMVIELGVELLPGDRHAARQRQAHVRDTLSIRIPSE